MCRYGLGSTQKEIHELIAKRRRISTNEIAAELYGVKNIDDIGEDIRSTAIRWAYKCCRRMENRGFVVGHRPESKGEPIKWTVLK